MSKLRTRHHLRPLSFKFTRPAEHTELALFVDKIEKHFALTKNGMNEIGRALLLGLISFAFVAPVSFFFAYLTEKITGLRLLAVENLITFAFFWMSLFLIHACTSQIVQRKFALTQLKAMKADLKNQMVEEETWRFVAAKTLDIPETTDFYYLMLADTGEILALSAQQLKDSTQPSHEIGANLAPADLTLIRAPLSQRLIKSFSSGPLLEPEGRFSYLGARDNFPIEGENLRLTKGLNWAEIESYAMGLKGL
jgi:hypothetical protein